MAFSLSSFASSVSIGTMYLLDTAFDRELCPYILYTLELISRMSSVVKVVRFFQSSAEARKVVPMPPATKKSVLGTVNAIFDRQNLPKTLAFMLVMVSSLAGSQPIVRETRQGRLEVGRQVFQQEVVTSVDERPRP
jgi:hypothetical protein